MGPNAAAPIFTPTSPIKPAAPPPGKKFTGNIKSFNTNNGFGFIQCPETHELYGRDVFFNQAIAGGPEIGAQVIFEVTLNPEGQPQARGATRAKIYDSDKVFR